MGFLRTITSTDTWNLALARFVLNKSYLRNKHLKSYKLDNFIAYTSVRNPVVMRQATPIALMTVTVGKLEQRRMPSNK